jgi:methylmalonyl-CoA carboxyltransferase large subunit
MSPADDSAAALIPELLVELRALRAQVTQLTSKVASLEDAARAELEAVATLAPPALAAVAPPVAPAPEELLPDEVLLVLSAAVAAFLGKRARVRGIRVLSSASWAHQGRVSIQASHARPPQR